MVIDDSSLKALALVVFIRPCTSLFLFLISFVCLYLGFIAALEQIEHDVWPVAIGISLQQAPLNCEPIIHFIRNVHVEYGIRERGPMVALFCLSLFGFL